MKDITLLYNRVGNLRHACPTWHTNQFPMARGHSKFYDPFVMNKYIDLNLYTHMCVAGILNDLKHIVGTRLSNGCLPLLYTMNTFVKI